MTARIPLALATFSGATALSVALFSPAAVAGTPTIAGSYAADSGSTAVSADWAGYDVTGSTYTSVSASWVQPTVTCDAGESSFSAFWVGLDGDGSESVEQIGTSSDCDNGTADYTAWYEFYPSDSVQLPNTVKAGDKLTASVTSDANGEYTLKLTDETQGWTKTQKGSSPQGTNASAEIIAEAPSSSRQGDVLPLANFKTVDFSDVTVNGKKLTELDGTNKIDMASQSAGGFGYSENSAATTDTMASTSDLTSAGGFSVDWKGAGSSDSSSSGFPGGSGWPGSSGQGSSGQGSSGQGSSGQGSSGQGSSGSGSQTSPWGDGSTGSDGYPTDPFGDGSTGTQGDGSQTDPYGDGSTQTQQWPGFDVPWDQILPGSGLEGWDPFGDGTSLTDLLDQLGAGTQGDGSQGDGSQTVPGDTAQNGYPASTQG